MRRYSPPRCGVDFPRDAFSLASRRGCSALPRKQGHKLCTDRYYNLNCAILRASTSPILRGGRKIQISRRYFFARHPCSCNRKIAIERASRQLISVGYFANRNPKGIYGMTKIVRSSGTRIQRMRFPVNSRFAFAIAERMPESNA